MIEQEPFCGVRTHFYHDASSYDMFRDRRVVERQRSSSGGATTGAWNPRQSPGTVLGCEVQSFLMEHKSASDCFKTNGKF